MLSNFAIRKLEELTSDYLKVECPEGTCYGVFAVHRICFALTMFHAFLAISLFGIENTRNKRAALQNGWWGPKILMWIALLVVSFFIPTEFFMFWGNYIALIGAAAFILLGLVLLIDFAHTWSETCLEKWEATDNNIWKWVLVVSTLGMYAAAITLTGLMYGFFAGSNCKLNQFFISFNLAVCAIATALSVHPAVQDANPRSGLSQAAMVVVYCTYLITSAVANEPDDKECNPLTRSGGTRTTTVILGAIFTFLAIAYSTSRAAVQGRNLISVGPRDDGYAYLAPDEPNMPLTDQPRARSSALIAAVEAGVLPASALDDSDDEDDDDGKNEARDDEKTGVKYSYTFFHLIFIGGAMYVAMLLTNWNVVTQDQQQQDQEKLVYIGRSYAAVWVKVVSSWICLILYIWTLVAPLVMPDRYGDM